MGDMRPKLEIVKPAVRDPEANDVEIYIDGKFIAGGSRAHHSAASLAAIESVARHVARTLGAEVVAVNEPTPVPYRYFITYAVLATGWKAALVNPGQVFCSRWVTLYEDIEGPADTETLARMIADEFSYPVLVNIIGITYMDGPY